MRRPDISFHQLASDKFPPAPPPPLPLALCIRPLTTLVEFTITAAEAFSPSGMHLKVDYLQEFGLGVFLKTIRCEQTLSQTVGSAAGDAV